MSAVPPTPRVKLRTATRRVPRTRNAEAGTSTVAEAEPNMRLSRAILVMLLLHVVAVGGILAFSLIKERGQTHASNSPANGAVEAEDSDLVPTKVEGHDNDHLGPDIIGTSANARSTHSGDNLTPVSNDPTTAGPTSNAANDAVTRIAGGRPNGAGTPPSTNVAAGDKNNHPPVDSGKTYVVQKGDSLYSIAEKLKVDASVLIKLNGIDDPKKLKIGQTLHLPGVSHSKGK